MKNKHHPLVEIVIYIIVYILFFALGFLLLIFILNTFNRPFLVEGESMITVIGVAASTLLAIAALWQSHTANKINERLMDLEVSRDQQAVAPFVLIGDGKAGVLSETQAINSSKTIMIYIGGEPFQSESGHLMYYALVIDFMNTTDHPLRLHFESMVSQDHEVKWAHSVSGNGMYGTLIMPGASGKILFYGDQEKFKNPNGYNMKLILENRFTERYRETATIYIMGYKVDGKNSKNYVHLISQAYHVEKIQKTTVFSNNEL